MAVRSDLVSGLNVVGTTKISISFEVLTPSNVQHADCPALIEFMVSASSDNTRCSGLPSYFARSKVWKTTIVVHPGLFLLTGSANILRPQTVSDSLAGRTEVVTLLLLGQSEIKRGKNNFLDKAFKSEVSEPKQIRIGNTLIEQALTGGYPDMVARRDRGRRATWAREYIRAKIEQDVREIADLERLDERPQLPRAIAHHLGHLLNFKQLAGQVGLDAKTARRFIGLFENLFLARRVEPWFRNP